MTEKSSGAILARAKILLGKNEIGTLIPLVLLSIYIGISNPVFFSLENVINNLRSTSFIFIIGIAMTFVLIGGGLDLSVGSSVALTGVITGLCVTQGIPVFFSILIGMGTGALIGLFNGLVIVLCRIPPLIVTLGSMYMGKGLVLIITEGSPVFPLPEKFNIIGQGSFFFLPYVVLVALALWILADFVLKHTTNGRAVCAVGGNEETARLAGIKTSQIKISTYLLTGLCSAVTGILMAARLESAQPNSGSGYELLVVAAVIIGGTSLFGGSGSIHGTAIGALFMTVISNGMVLLKVSVYWQNFVIGAIIILAVALDQYRRSKSGLT